MTAIPAANFRPGLGAMPGLFGEIIVDLFAGGGGMSLGIEHATGRCVDEAVNHDAAAIWMHRINHPNTRHHRDSVWRLDPLAVSEGRPVGLLHGSPDCTHFSIARGGKPVKKAIRGLAWCVLRWTAKLRPRILTMENVREFLTWGPLVQKRAGRNLYVWEARHDLRMVGHSCQIADNDEPIPAGEEWGRRTDDLRHPRQGQRSRKNPASSKSQAGRRSNRRDKSTGKPITVDGPHADDGSAGPWRRMLEALGYAVEPLMTPDKRRASETFKAWKRQLEDLGYKVEHQVLDAADYGAPTHRRRLFIVARRDGRAIRWPSKTHGDTNAREAQPTGRTRSNRSVVRKGHSAIRGANGVSASDSRSGREDVQGAGSDEHGSGKLQLHQERRSGLKPFRTAAECIEDWSNCPSIFGRKKDLAENTLRRIVRGLVKFTIEAADPFIVQVNHGGQEFRGQAIAEPLPTLSAKHGFGLIIPYTVGAGGRSPDPRDLLRPLGTILPRDWPALVAPHITQYNGLKGGEVRGFDLLHPFNVVPTENRFGLASAFLYDRYGERAGQDPRCRDVLRPLGCVTGTANGGNLVVPYLYTNVIGAQPGQSIDRSLGAITTVHNKFNLITPYLVEFANSKWNDGSRAAKVPMPTLTARPKGGSWNVVVPFLAGVANTGTTGRGSYVWNLGEPIRTITSSNDKAVIAPLAVKFYGSGIVKPIDSPLDSITSRDRFGMAAAQLTRLPSGDRSSLASAWIVKHYAGHYEGAGLDPRGPLHTITAWDHHALASVSLCPRDDSLERLKEARWPMSPSGLFILSAIGSAPSIISTDGAAHAPAGRGASDIAAFVTHLRGTHGRGVGGTGLSMLDVFPTLTGGGGGHLYLTTGAMYAADGQAVGCGSRESASSGGPGVGARGFDERSGPGVGVGRVEPGLPVQGTKPIEGRGGGDARCGAAEPATIFTPRELMGPSDSPAINRGFWRVYDLLRRFLGAAAPLPIVRKRDASGRVAEYLIHDLGMRMLAPRELLNAQFGPELAKHYVLTGSRESQVAKIGNSVPPLLGAAVVGANWHDAEGEVAA